MTEDPCSLWLARYGAAMLLFARQFAPSLADAEDIVQEAFLRALRKPARPDDPRVYLFACVRNAALDSLRSQRRRARRESSVALSAPLLVSPGDQGEFREAVEASLAHLPNEQRAVLVLKVWGELTFAQVGEALQIPPNTAASRYRSACEQLRRLLSKEVVR